MLCARRVVIRRNARDLDCSVGTAIMDRRKEMGAS